MSKRSQDATPRRRVARETGNLLAEQTEQLRGVFPEVFTEGKVDWEKLRAALGNLVDDRPERYSFTWAGKRDAIRLLQTPSRATLVPAKEESVNFDTTQHLFIEGDNLEVLKLLYKPYFGRVKMMYFDPPYNTGNDFIYPDSFADPLDSYLKLTGQKTAEGNLLTTNPETSGRYHSAWLSMMYPRLFLARQLLREDGVVFISVDDHEVHNLRLMLNEMFGEENMLPPIVRRAKIGGGSDNKHVAREIDYVLGAARNIEMLPKFFLPHSEKDLMRYSQKDDQGSYFWDTYSRSGLASEVPESDSLFYEVKFPDGTKRSDRWRRSQARLKLDIDQGEAKYVQTPHGWNIHFKQRLNDDGKRPRQILFDGMGNTEGSADLETVWPGLAFSYPKPISLISHLAKICAAEDSIVLDLFAGSGTTAQALLELNREDGGNRRFIMVQLPEPTDNKQFPTIAEIGKERIRRVIKKMVKERKGELDLKSRTTPEDLGFKVFKLAASNYRQWEGVETKDAGVYAETLKLHTDPLVDGWKAEKVIYEVVIKEGYGLNCRVEKVKEVKESEVWRVTDPDKAQSFLICLDDTVPLKGLKPLALKKDDLFICRDCALDDAAAANLALQCRLKTI